MSENDSSSSYGSETDEIYKDVTNYKDLIDINVKFLKGEIPFTFFYGDKIADETIPLVGKLIEINQNGFMSLEGQPPVMEKTHKQRGYISGYFHQRRTHELLTFLKTKPVFYSISSYQGYYDSNFEEEMTNLTCYIENNEWIYPTNSHDIYHFEHCYQHHHVDEIFENFMYIDIVCKDYGTKLSVEDYLLEYFQQQ